MNAKLFAAFGALPALAVLLLAGCATPLPPGAERGPHNTMAYDVLVESIPPGAQIEANGATLGPTPLHLKIFGDPDGTFHDFGSYYYIVRALPTSTSQFPQMRAFRTGRGFTPEDRVPQRIVFNMNQPPAAYQAGPGPGPGPAPGPYPYPYPYYYGPYGYPYAYPYYYGPYYGPRVFIGPGWRRW